MTLKTPVAFLIFNRPETTKRVFEAIRQAKPQRLLVVADGPRAERLDEAEKCRATRAIVESVDWDCEVLKNYSETNLGCKHRVSSGLDWVFSQVEEAIILEDDCLPHISFFRFCAELLERYRDDDRIMMVSGDNFQFGKKRTEESYYFSRYPHTWGWATWRRAWQHYDATMQQWPKVREGNWLKDILQNSKAVKTWTKLFQKVYEGKIDTWDYAWTLACWTQSGLTILPAINLVSNIGFHSEATHTQVGSHKLANLSTQAITFPLQHPSFIIRDAAADQTTQASIFDVSLFARIRGKIKTLYL